MESQEKQQGEESLSETVKVIWGVVNFIAVFLTLVVLVGAILLPSAMGRGGTPAGRMWQGFGILVFLCAIFAIVKKNSFSLLYLCLACAFFFVSCTSNFRWGGG